jgi:D-beta-D-heptose 7-phosphate kinase/D-beta-D-heptose 1-phosphate adenosyltransferase
MNDKRLKEIVAEFKGKRIAVLGDLMLDAYVFGKASRISQEAPVPVVQVKKMHQTLGGAANVMRNVITLGGQVSAFGLIGDDLTGQELLTLLKDYEINHDGVLVDASRRTIQKKRVIAGAQQLVRIDYEDIHPVSEELREKLVSRIIEEIKQKEIDAVIFEDYAKGLLNVSMLDDIIREANKMGVITALDPHPGHPLEAKGLVLMTPNRSEAFGLAGVYCSDPISPVENDKNLNKVSAALLEKWEAKHLLITLGAQGMALFEGDGNRFVIPTRAREVFDVSGAGDTVIAAYTLALLGGATAVEAAEIANHAAGVVVGKVGTVSVELEELMKSFEDREE